MKYSYIFFLIAVLSISCNSKSSQSETEENEVDFYAPIVVDLKKLKETTTPLQLSEFAEHISYIPLSDDVLLKDIEFTSVKVTDDYFFIDGENVFKYDKNGKFIKALFVEGGGPEEAKKLNVTPAAFNYEENYCTFPNAYGNTYKSFSFDGTYIGEEPVSENTLTEKIIPSYFKNNQIYYYKKHGFSKGDKVNVLGDYLWYAKNTKTDSVVYRFINPVANETAVYGGRYLELPGEYFFKAIDSLFWFKHIAMDTLFVTSNLKEFHPKYIFKTDNSFMDLNFFIRFKVYDMHKEEFLNTKVIAGVLPLDAEKLLYVVDNKTAFLNSSKDVSIYTAQPLVNDLDANLSQIDLISIICNNTYFLRQGYLYFLVDAYHFFEDGSQPPVDSLTEDSNPVIVKLKLK